MTIFLLIFFLLLIVYWLLIDYYRRTWNSMPGFVPEGLAGVRVSVVVAVRNEEKNITQLLNCLYRQDYPKNLYEVIIVDDHSTDNTEKNCTAFYFPDLTKIFAKLGEGFTSKKVAITTGVSLASGDLIITTDADCEMGVSWISTIAACYAASGAKFIAAPVRMLGSRSVLGILQSLDFLTLQGITGASVFRRFHTMCNGANLAYPRAVFKEVGGFAGIDAIPSGDDMLLMNKVFRKYPEEVVYLKNREAIVTTWAEASWKNFLHQRVRWASKAVHYDDKRIFYVLLLVYLLNACFLVMAIAAAVHSSWLMFLLLFLLAKIIIEFPFVNATALFFGQTSLMIYFPFFQPVHILYTIIAGWLGRFGSYNWKSRTIKN